MKTCCSFLPAATQIIYDLGLEHLLHGVTFECPEQSRKEKEIVVRCSMEGKDLSSEEIDRIFSESKATGESLYSVEESKLQELEPNIIFTQDVCEVCQIDTECANDAISNLPNPPQLVPLTPIGLEDVFQTAIDIGQALEEKATAIKHIDSLQARVDEITDTLRKHKVPLRRVMLMEWIKPIYNCGHWIPQQIAYAGGVDMLSNPNGDSIVTQWDKVVRYDPEVLVIAPCGFHVDRTLEEIEKLSSLPEFTSLQAVKKDQVYIMDFDLFTQPSPSTLTLGIEALAKAFHPDIFSLPEELKGKFMKYTKDAL